MQDLKLSKGPKEPTAASTAVQAAVEQGSKYVHRLPAIIGLLTESPSLISVSISTMYVVPLALLAAYFAWRFYSGSA